MRLLRRITRSVEDSEDLAQEAFLRAYRALDRFDLERPFRPWLWTIGIRLALQAIAKKGRDHASLDGSNRSGDDERRGDGPWLADNSPAEQIEGRLMHRDLMEALDRMDPQHRAVLILRVIEERTYEEIAAILEIPQGTVMSRLNRARISLRKLLSGWFPAGEEDDGSV
jgi:RNA polymerase sigma-70 factor, ECF subfamily